MSGHTFPKFSGTVTQSSHKRVSFWPLSHHERITQGGDEMGPNSWGKQNLAPTRFLFHLNPLPVDFVGKFRTLWANATLWAKPVSVLDRVILKLLEYQGLYKDNRIPGQSTEKWLA